MRLGGPVFGDTSNPDLWIEALRKSEYTAAYCPLDSSACDALVEHYVKAAKEANIVIAEVGAWSNPLSPGEATRTKALEHCKAQLDLADRVGARCCVNIAGSRGEQWDGPDPANLTPETFDRIVAVIRDIIDAVKPKRTFYTLETMPWMYPDSPDCYLQLIKTIDRTHFAVHLDPANLLCSPQRFYANGDLIRECFAKLGPHIRSCHGKDITLSGKLMTHLDEVRPGLGGMDYATLLQELSKLEPDVTLMLEHLATEDDYKQAAEHVRSVARKEGISL
jgi:sugar phosphate isomerase/epimerase